MAQKTTLRILSLNPVANFDFVANFHLFYLPYRSDMADMEGGELEIIKMEKYNGMKALSEGSLKPEVVGAF